MSLGRTHIGTAITNCGFCASSMDDEEAKRICNSFPGNNNSEGVVHMSRWRLVETRVNNQVPFLRAPLRNRTDTRAECLYFMGHALGT